MTPAETSFCPQCGKPRPAGPWNGICPTCVARVSFALPAEDPTRPAAVAGGPADVSSAGARPSGTRFGDYDLLEEIGRGGMGVVYRARQIRLDRIVAVKMIPFGPLATEELVERFRLEAEAAARLRHPNITAIHEVGERDGQHYFSMDYIEGGTLGDLVADGPLPVRRAASLLRTIAEAVHYAHEHDILHRDLKPSNILIDQQGQPHITDFGLARRLTGDSTLTLTGAVLGSPNYMPPEQASPDRTEPSPRSDLYSLGAVLYRMLAGQPPFQAESVELLLRRLLTDEPIAPRLLNPGVPVDLETICLKCLSKEPARRYASAGELVDELGRFLRDEPILARPAGRAEKLWRWGRRRPALAASLGLLSLALLTGGSGVLWQWHRAERAGADTRHHLYAADMELAYRLFGAGDMPRARRLLQAYWPARQAQGRPVPTAAQEDLRGWEWRYLWEQTRGDEWRVLAKHRGAVPALDCSPDGRWVASGDVFGALKIWDATAEREVLATNLNAGSIGTLAFSPDGRLLAHTTARSEVWLWDTALWRRVGALRHLGVQELAFSPDGRFLATASGQEGEQVLLWEVATRKEWKRIQPGRDWTRPKLLAFAPDGRTLAIGDAARGVVVFWDWQADVEQAGVRAHRPVPDGSDALGAMCFSQNGALFATAGGDTTVRLRKPGEKNYRFMSNHTEAVTCIAFSPDGGTLASGAMDRFVRLWDVRTRRELAGWQAHGGGCLRVRFTPAGTNILTSGVDGLVKVWGLQPKAREPVVKPLPAKVWEVMVFADPPIVALASSPNEFEVWNLRSLEPIHQGQHLNIEGRGFPSAPRTYASLKGAPQGRILERDGRAIQFRRLADGVVEPFVTSEPNDLVISLDLSHDGHRLVVSALDHIAVWDVPAKRLVRRWAAPGEGTDRHTRISPDGFCVAALHDSDGTVEFRDVSSGRTRVLSGHLLGAAVLCFSADSRRLATAGRGAAVRVYDVPARKEVASFEASRGPVSALGFSPDDQRLACGTAKGSIVLFDLATRREVATLAGHETMVYSLVFLDADTLASATQQEVRLWPAPALKLGAAGQD